MKRALVMRFDGVRGTITCQMTGWNVLLRGPTVRIFARNVHSAAVEGSIFGLNAMAHFFLILFDVTDFVFVVLERQ